MKTYYNYILILFFIPGIAFAKTCKKGKYQKQKTIKKEFAVNPNSLLKVNNSYGNLDLVTWNENRTVIEVTIITYGNDEEEVNDRLQEITIDFNATPDMVSATTIFGSKKKYWKWWKLTSRNVKLEVNYTIKFPVTSSIEIKNDYGAINLNKLEGHALINCDYGQLIIGDLLAEDNLLNFDYTNKSTIDYMKSGVITADYSDFTIEEADKLTLKTNYTRSEIKKVNTLTYSCDYGKMIIGTASVVSGQGDYIPTHIKFLLGSLAINSDYGSIKIDEITKTFTGITIKADYTNVKLGFNPDVSFSFVINLDYADLIGKENVMVTKSAIHNRNRKFLGYYNKQNSNASIIIDSEYGTVSLIKN